MRGVVLKRDLSGKRYGKLFVIERRGKRGGSWLCKCDCGKNVILPASDFLSGGQIACGCMNHKGTIKHNMHGTAFYKKFDGMKRRCGDKNNHNWSRYGARGIKCLWKSFEDFRDDMYGSYLTHCKKYGPRYTTIERIDNDGHYCKENCRWATPKEQSANRGVSSFFIYRGQRLTIKQWAEKYNIHLSTLWGRVHNLGWSFEDALRTKPNLGNRYLRKSL